MRHVAFILLSVVLVITGTAELALGLDGFLFGGAGAGLSGYLMVGSSWLAGTLAVTLAEEVVEAVGRRRKHSQPSPVPGRHSLWRYCAPLSRHNARRHLRHSAPAT